jgi:hypothetical protein
LALWYTFYFFLKNILFKLINVDNTHNSTS